MNNNEFAATFQYWYRGEQLEREQRARRGALAAEARRSAASAASRPARKQALLPRIAGALGLF